MTISLILKSHDSSRSGFKNGKIMINAYYGNTIEEILIKFNENKQNKFNKLYNIYGIEMPLNIKLYESLEFYVDMPSS